MSVISKRDRIQVHEMVGIGGKQIRGREVKQTQMKQLGGGAMCQ
jgi:hypothetical protein